MPKRPDGYYWVKEPDRDWSIAYCTYYELYDEHNWSFMGTDESCDESELKEIDERQIIRIPIDE